LTTFIVLLLVVVPIPPTGDAPATIRGTPEWRIEGILDYLVRTRDPAT